MNLDLGLKVIEGACSSGLGREVDVEIVHSRLFLDVLGDSRGWSASSRALAPEYSAQISFTSGDLYGPKASDLKEEKGKPESPTTINSFNYSQRHSDRTILDCSKKFFRLLNAKSAHADISKLLGAENLSKISNGQSFTMELPVTTELGGVNLTVKYRPDYSELYFHVPDSHTAGSALTFRINQTGRPSLRLQVDDSEGLFAGLFHRAGYEGLAANVADSTEEAFQKRLMSLTSVERTRNLLETMLNDPSRHINLTEVLPEGAKIFVPQARYGLAPLKKPLSTHSLDTCAALVIRDTNHGMHYLAHIDSLVKPKQISDSLKMFDLAHSEIYVMPGKTPSGVTQNIVATFVDDSKATANIKFVDWDGSGMFPSIASWQGKLYRS